MHLDRVAVPAAIEAEIDVAERPDAMREEVFA
jgi:hypothetical protein